MRESIRLESMVDKFIMRPHVITMHHTIYDIAMKLYSNEIELIRKRICPFCNRRFKQIHIHLKGNGKSSPCMYSYAYMLKSIVNEYLEMRKS